MSIFKVTRNFRYFSLALSSVIGMPFAYGQSYTKCAVESPESTSLDLCLPTANGSTVSLQLVRDPAHSSLVAVVPVKNCRAASTNVRGGVSLAVDSSASMKNPTTGLGTDPDGIRLTAAAALLRSVQSNAQAQLTSGVISTTSNDFPRLSAVSYGGRQSVSAGTVDNPVFESDGLNLKTTPVYCKTAEGATGEVDAYPTGREDRWSTKTGSVLTARCEMLTPFLATTSSSATSSTPGVERTVDFLNFTGSVPRGSTDFSYIFRAFSRAEMLGGSLSTARNAIVITDGLPNIPKRIPKATCDQKSYLRNGPVFLSETGVSYCSDRQFRTAANLANTTLEDYTNFKFNTINMYTFLFLGNGKGYIDIDDEGQLNPADFLIEASARTGNGKVKFKIARTAADLSSYLTSIYGNFSETSVQRVEIKVNANPTYTAVSPGGTNKSFSLKFINLVTGANTVVVTTYYTDSTFTRTYNVNVATTGSITSPYQCTTADGTKTVDGDDPTSKTPAGDGVLPFPIAGTGDTTKDGAGKRVFRNNDEVNKLDPNDFNTVENDDNSTRSKIEDGRLRLQGGTGNCGVIAGLSTQKNGWLFLVFLPAFLVLLRYVFKKKSIPFLLATFYVFTASRSADAVGLNSENFVPSIGRNSPLLWESADLILPNGFIYGYTFDYALHPVEFGNGGTERKAVNDHLQVNHFSIGYGLFPFINLGFDVPVALYSAPSDVDGALRLQNRSRSTFFLGDMGLYAELTPSFVRGNWGAGTLLFHFALPTGNSEAMLSDDALKITVYSPWDFKVFDNWEPYVGVGASFWQTSTRVESEFLLKNNSRILLERTRSLLLNGGLRYWFLKQDNGLRGIKFDVGIRSDSSNFSPSFNNNESPIEWAAGAAWYMDRHWSFHGSLGSGMGHGVGAPLSRLIAGVRYSDETIEQHEDDDPDTRLSSEAMSEKELDQILRRGQGETMPPRLDENDSMLRLMTVRDEVFDIGTVRFEFDSSRLTSEAKRTVRKLYDYLRRFHPHTVRIDGHTDSIGSYYYNLALSKRRAQSVKDELTHLGWPAQSMSTEGFSYKYPVESNAAKSGRAKNRRIEVALDGKSFRKSSYSTGEKRQFQEWIAPGGKKPNHPEQ